MAVMILVDEGKIGLEDPAKYFPGAPKRWKRSLVRHLLTHTSGSRIGTDRLSEGLHGGRSSRWR
jgi:CubicO group peptidase (beta-lactamase class C family)